eukprot:6214434-Pleurochrysis_carterae.AAC.1
MNKLYVQLQRRLLPVLLLTYGEEPHSKPYNSWSPTSTSIYGAEPYIEHGLHYRGNRHHIKHSCRSDTSDRVAGNIPHIPPSAYTAGKACPGPSWGVEGRICIITLL